ncbi:neurosecretory protein VGF-like [Oncorhynchus mykiss]|uniref:neurosecretory protein VGF-like n=1 Tax=Oncorhynchus mykiss TaxID=8022 RepID=UPI00187887CA|nr:neurosecretory protein VGF-like [Oncorhynchus mykiss]
MTQSQFATSALILLVILLGLTLTLPSATSVPVPTETHSPSDSHAPPPPGLRLPEGERDVQEGKKGRLPRRERAEEEEEEGELFGDMDPKTLAAVLLEAMNKPHGERMNGGVEDGRKDEERGEEEERESQEEKGEEVRAALEEGADRDRDGREELELVMAAAAEQGTEERQREEEEERKRAQEEEERLTEKVTSRTTSQTVPVKEKQPPTVEGRGEEVGVKEVGAREEAQKGPPTSQEIQQEEQEQLSPEEVQNLQTMLEELQNYNTANKRERESQAQEQRERESRGYNQHDTDQALMDNQIKPKAKGGYPLAMSKKKLKWQEETQKALNMPTYRGGNFMDHFDDNLAHQTAEDEEDDEGDEDEEEVLSPQEEERRAKEEQEEVRRQAKEAQRAKAEEEKLADIASDMLLQYMVKQDKGKYSNQNKKTLLSNAAEDKRSDEEVVSEDDDIDPQTIDKLIEISSKLHLPADDIVDIISDVEKKKKKDTPEMLPWQRPQQRPLVPPAAAAFDTQPSAPRNPTLNQPSPAINPLKAWFMDISSSKQDPNVWIKPRHKSFRTSSSNYPAYPFYQQRPYRGYYPLYFPPPKPKPRYYAKSSLNDLLSNSLDYDFDFPPKRRYRPWVQPRPRNPPVALRQKLYYPKYLLPSHPRTYNHLPIPMAKPRSSPPRGQFQPRRRHGYYYQAPPAPLVTRDQDYYGMQELGQQQQDSDEDLENYIQQVFMKPRPRMYQ